MTTCLSAFKFINLPLFSTTETIAFRSTSLTEQLFLSALDLALHVNDEYWKDVMEVVWKKYMDPLSLPRAYNYPMSLVDLASKDTAAGIFTNIWSQVGNDLV